MKAPASCILLVAYLAVTSNLRVCAGPQSLLDPYASIQAPSSKTKGSKSSSKSEAKKASNTHSELSSSEGEEEKPAQKEAKPLKTKGKDKELSSSKPPGEGKALKPSHATGSSDTGVLSGIGDIKNSYVKTFKAAGSGIVNGTKAVGSKVAGGTKKMRDGVASGAQAIGHGFKLTGGKVKNGASSVGNKVASAPSKLNHSEKTEPVQKTQAESDPQAVSEKVLDDASYPGRPLEPLATKPLVKGAPTGGPSMLGRTFGKLNVFGHKQAKKPQTPPMARPRAAATDLNQPFPN